MFLDGFEEEGLVESSPEGLQDPNDPSRLVDQETHQAGSTKITDSKYEAVFDGQQGELAAFGIPEHHL